MSSILDALKKLETDKAASKRSSGRAFETLPPEQQLTGKKPQARSTRPLVLIGAGALGAVLLVTLSVGVSLFVVRGADRVGPVASVAVLPAPDLVPAPVAPEQVETPVVTPSAVTEEKPKIADSAPAVEPTPPVQPVEPKPELTPPVPPPAEKNVEKPAVAVEIRPAEAAAVNPEAKPEPEVVAEVKAPSEPEPLVKPEDKAVTEEKPATAKEPKPEPVVEPLVLAKTTAPTVVAPQPRVQPGPIDVKMLPPLRNSDKPLYGLENVQLNMLRPASKNRPYASAIINLQPVEIGEVISGSIAILIAVEKDAVAIEIQDSGERFQVRF